MYNVQEYMALKKMEANAKKAEEFRVHKIEPGLVNKLNKKIKIHQN